VTSDPTAADDPGEKRAASKPAAENPQPGYNVLNLPAPPDGSWVTTNISEALPGVVSPLGWSLWAEATDRGMRAPFHAMGAIPATALAYPSRPEDRVSSLFYGRIALRVDFFCEMGDLIPGASGEAVARDALGYVPPDYVPRPSKRRWPMFALKLPVALATARRAAIRAHDSARDRYRFETARSGSLDLAAARAQYAQAAQRFLETMVVQAVTITAVIQPAFTVVTRVAERADIDPGRLMRGYGLHIEHEMIEQLWALSRGTITLDRFLSEHGHHGPDAGELSNPSWRVDPRPLLKIVDAYRRVPEEQDPATMAATAAADRRQAERELLGAVPWRRRGTARAAPALGRHNLPLRSHARLAYLYEVDIARAAALRIGELLVGAGTIDSPEDVYYFTGEEIVHELPADPRAVVEVRRALRDEYKRFELPPHWAGPPRPMRIGPPPPDGGPTVITALGVSPGIVEGLARVVVDPSEAELETGEVLVAHTTDPSWASIMYLAAALVVDLGGQLSHAAVVARELGIPASWTPASGHARSRRAIASESKEAPRRRPAQRQDLDTALPGNRRDQPRDNPNPRARRVRRDGRRSRPDQRSRTQRRRRHPSPRSTAHRRLGASFPHALTPTARTAELRPGRSARRTG
jgi:pyruvate, water dikinase